MPAIAEFGPAVKSAPVANIGQRLKTLLQQATTTNGPNATTGHKPQPPLLKVVPHFWGPILWTVDVVVILSIVPIHWPERGQISVACQVVITLAAVLLTVFIIAFLLRHNGIPIILRVAAASAVATIPVASPIVASVTKRSDATSVGRIKRAGALVSVTAVAVITATMCGSAASADPNQDQQFLALLDAENIGAVDGIPDLIARAHEICNELDGGTSMPAITDEETNTAYNDDPRLRLFPARVNATIIRFITASVDVYCPYDQGKLP